MTTYDMGQAVKDTAGQAATVRVGTITSISPLRITLGDTILDNTAVGVLGSYTPAVGDSVILLGQSVQGASSSGSSWIALGRSAASESAGTPTLTDEEPAAGTTTSTAYTPTLAVGVACGIAFTAPASGKVMIFHNCEITNSGANFSLATIRVRTGATIGAGADVLAALDNEAIFAASTLSIRFGGSKLLTGLTGGAPYNVQELFRVTAGTGTFQRKSLIVMPTQ